MFKYLFYYSSNNSNTKKENKVESQVKFSSGNINFVQNTDKYVNSEKSKLLHLLFIYVLLIRFKQY